MPIAPAGRSALLVLCYLPILGLAPLASRRADRELSWHARNGQLLFGAVVVLLIAATLLGLVFPSLTLVYGILLFFVLVVYSIVVILAVVKAIQGERLIVRGLSRYATAAERRRSRPAG